MSTGLKNGENGRMCSIITNYCVRGRERSNIFWFKKRNLGLKIFLCGDKVVAFWSYLLSGFTANKMRNAARMLQVRCSKKYSNATNT